MVEKVRDYSDVKMGSNRSFGIVFTVVFLIVSLFPLISGNDIRYWALLVAASFLVVSFAYPAALTPLNKFWFKFGLLLNAVLAPVLMFVLFAVTVTPIGIIFRLMGKDPLRLRRNSAATTYWLERDKERTGAMSNQF